MTGKHQSLKDVPVLNVLGMPHHILVAAHESESGYEYLQVKGMPGMGVPPHMHQHEDETFHVLAGKVKFMLEGEEMEAEAGDVVHLPRGTKHGFSIIGEAEAILNLVIMPGNLEGMFRELAELSVPPDPAQVAEITSKYDVNFV